ncbi:MAG: hypothetical protein OXI17_07905 [Gammaproteobacteria bacterium]|nr:hypothetical protein [Gammaproteobacteria bacterium]MDE0478301.1 hypothetical protein [Gammaproteobacteria bacterium]MDE0508544.1 hypothetical protein [Gammaproteobacteria bacterium]
MSALLMGLELDFVQGERFIQAYGAIVFELSGNLPYIIWQKEITAC